MGSLTPDRRRAKNCGEIKKPKANSHWHIISNTHQHTSLLCLQSTKISKKEKQKESTSILKFLRWFERV